MWTVSPHQAKHKNVPVLRNSAHVILSRCDWLRLVSSSRTGQWGGAVVCVRLVRRYICAAMRDAEEKNRKTNQRRVNVRVRERPHRCHRCLLSLEGLSGLSSGSEWGRRRPSSLTPQAPGRIRTEGMLRTPERGGWLMCIGGGPEASSVLIMTQSVSSVCSSRVFSSSPSLSVKMLKTYTKEFRGWEAEAAWNTLHHCG